MGRPPVFSPETKTRIVLSVLSGLNDFFRTGVFLVF